MIFDTACQGAAVMDDACLRQRPQVA